ncbi:unnamed protein product, partial [Ophioblennius macclurei]
MYSAVLIAAVVGGGVLLL